MSDSCVCGSGRSAANCCAPCISGVVSATSAEALMRSRYTAYVQCNRAYLLKTWHPSTRPLELQLEGPDRLQWLGLEILHSQQDTVEFIARYHAGELDQQIHEISRFVFEQGEWFYLDGQHSMSGVAGATRSQPSRNTPCPCGSGKKYKRCCGK